MTTFTGRKDKGISFDPKEGRTKQADAHDLNIHQLMSRYLKTGDDRILNAGNAMPMYGDFSKVPDFHTGKLQVLAAEALFNSLPSAIRKRFDHKAHELIEFMRTIDMDLVDQAVVNEAVELGLLPEDRRVKIPEPPKAPEGEEPPAAEGE